MAYSFTGAVPLLEASRFPDTKLAAGVIEVIIQESPILEQLPFLPLDGESYTARYEKTLPTVGFRQVNAVWTRTWGSFDKEVFGVAIMGGEVFVDNFIVRTRSKDQTKARQFRAVAKAAALTFDKYSIDGDGTGNSFVGVNEMIEHGFGQKEIVGSAGGEVLNLDDLDLCFDVMRVGSPDCIWCNRTHRRKVTSLGRTPTSGHALIDIGNDVFGRQVTQYNGTPMRIIGDDATGSQILGFDEGDDGTGSGDASSLYLVKFGEEENLFGILAAGGSMEVVDFGEQQEAPGHMGRIEFYPGLAILSKYAVVRLAGITAA